MAHMSMISLLYNTITTLFVLTLLSHLTATLVPQMALSRQELLTIYVAISVSKAIGGHMLIQLLFPIIGYAFAFATPENDWQALFCNYIPPWISVKDKQALICFSGIQRFTPNNTSLYTKQHIKTWSTPLLCVVQLSICPFLGNVSHKLHYSKTMDGKRKTKHSTDSVALGHDQSYQPLFLQQGAVAGRWNRCDC